MESLTGKLARARQATPWQTLWQAMDDARNPCGTGLTYEVLVLQAHLAWFPKSRTNRAQCSVQEAPVLQGHLTSKKALRHRHILHASCPVLGEITSTGSVQDAPLLQAHLR